MSEKRRLSDDNVREIRMLYRNGWSIRALANQFDRNYHTIRTLVKRETYLKVAETTQPDSGEDER